MNLIYQGKVTSVEIQNADGEWEPLPNWEQALWQHHELFQDAVKYYSLAFAALT